MKRDDFLKVRERHRRWYIDRDRNGRGRNDLSGTVSRPVLTWGLETLVGYVRDDEEDLPDALREIRDGRRASVS